jgi:hypothetical protein
MKKKILLVLVLLIIVCSFAQKKQVNKNELEFKINNYIFDQETGNTTLNIKVSNIGLETLSLGSFIIYLYDNNHNMLVSSFASICIYDKTNCNLKPFKSKEFELIVGIDASKTKFIEYKLD